jgi:hypothetical protein
VTLIGTVRTKCKSSFENIYFSTSRVACRVAIVNKKFFHHRSETKVEKSSTLKQEMAYKLYYLVYFICLMGFLAQKTSSNSFFSNNFKFSNDASNNSSGDDEFYQRLELARTASAAEIKSAYRKKAMQTHPDRGGNEEEFKKLVEAYEILSDEKKRKLYDRYGKSGVQNIPQSSSASSPFEGAGSGFPFSRSNFQNFFQSTFSLPTIYHLEISLEDLFSGKNITLLLPNQED